MLSSKTKPAATMFLVLSSVAARAETPADFFSAFKEAREVGKASHMLEIDNDTLLLNRNDGFFSSGIRYTQSYAVRDADRATTYAWRLGQDLYTASDIKLPPEAVKAPDHPYAGWLYGGVYKDVRHADGARARYGVDLGCLGPCAGGEWTQTNFHRVISQPLPRGWSRQVKNELGVVLHGAISPVRWAPANWVDVEPTFSGRFGNIFTDVGAGVTTRFGRLGGLGGEPALYGYVRANVEAVGYNATLQGGYFSKDNPHTVQPKRLVGEGEVGVVWRGAEYALSASVVRRGNEIRDLPDSTGAQNFVHLQFVYTP